MSDPQRTTQILGEDMTRESIGCGICGFNDLYVGQSTMERATDDQVETNLLQF
jgi:hypothetical protein